VKTGVRIPYNGQTVDADEMEFQTEASGPTVFKLEDGTRIEVNHATVSIYRLLHERDKDGSPIYVVVGSLDMKKKIPPGQGGNA
jgi:hypothetical protein